MTCGLLAVYPQMLHVARAFSLAGYRRAVLACLLFALVASPCYSQRLVKTGLEFLEALKDPTVSTVQLAAGRLVVPSPSAPVQIGPNRIVQVIGEYHETQTDYLSNVPEGTAVVQFSSELDWAGLSGVLRLGDNTTLTFAGIIIHNSLSLLGYDFSPVLPSGGAKVAVRFAHVVKTRAGCLPLQIFVQHVNSYARLNTSSARLGQAASLRPFCYVPPLNASDKAAPAQSCMQETLAVDDLATSILRSNGLSYELYESYSTYWCKAYASMSCLSASGPEQCVKDLTPNGTTGHDVLGPVTDESSSNPLTNILLPAVLTGVLTLGLVTATVWCIHRRGKQQRGSSAAAHGDGADVEGGGARAPGAGPIARNVGRVGGALARLLPRAPGGHSDPSKRGYVSSVSQDALQRIAKVRAELSSKMVVASSSDDLSDVRSLQLIGKGTFGRVYKGDWRGVTVAMKVISVPVSQYGQAQWQQVVGEAAIATLLNHPCVLQTFSVALLEYSPRPHSIPEEGGSDSNSPGDSASGQLEPFYQLKMVSEFCEGGAVVAALNRMRFYESLGSGGMVRLPAILDIASQVASGMAYLHSANIIHADLKAANVLLKQQPGCGRLQAKVADFGLSFRVEDPNATHVTKGQLGSLTHMAPEVLVHGRVSKASDVYSFGILLYELYTGEQAYYDVPPPMLAYHVTTAGGRPVLPQHCPAAFRGLAKACWVSEPAARPTFKEVYDSLQALSAEAQRVIRGTRGATASATGSGTAAGAGGTQPAGSAAAAEADKAHTALSSGDDPAPRGRVAPPPSAGTAALNDEADACPPAPVAACVADAPAALHAPGAPDSSAATTDATAPAAGIATPVGASSEAGPRKEENMSTGFSLATSGPASGAARGSGNIIDMDTFTGGRDRHTTADLHPDMVASAMAAMEAAAAEHVSRSSALSVHSR